MTKEEKILLIQDLCSRLPYGVHVKHIPTGLEGKLDSIDLVQYYNNTNFVQDLHGAVRFFGEDFSNIEDFRPMLRPLSDMTDEEWKERSAEWQEADELIEKNTEKDNLTAKEILPIVESKDLSYLYAHHIDVNGLIPKNLAIQVSRDYYFD